MTIILDDDYIQEDVQEAIKKMENLSREERLFIYRELIPKDCKNEKSKQMISELLRQELTK